MNSLIDLGILLGGFFALMSVLVARENQVAVFRREWLNKSSQDLEEFCIKARSNLFEAIMEKKKDSVDRESLKEISLSVTVIRARMNIKEPLVKEMLKRMGAVVDELLGYIVVKNKLIKAKENGEDLSRCERIEEIKQKRVYRAIARFEKSKYLYFKSEWVRLRDGELFTRSSLVLCGCFSALLILKVIFGFFGL